MSSSLRSPHAHVQPGGNLSLPALRLEGFGGGGEVGELRCGSCQVQHPEPAIRRRHQALAVDVREGLPEARPYLLHRLNGSPGYGNQAQEDSALLKQFQQTKIGFQTERSVDSRPRFAARMSTNVWLRPRR